MVKSSFQQSSTSRGAIRRLGKFVAPIVAIGLLASVSVPALMHHFNVEDLGKVQVRRPPEIFAHDDIREKGPLREPWKAAQFELRPGSIMPFRQLDWPLPIQRTYPNGFRNFMQDPSPALVANRAV